MGWGGVTGTAAPRRHARDPQTGTAAEEGVGGAAPPGGVVPQTGGPRAHHPFGWTAAGSATGGARLAPSPSLLPDTAAVVGCSRPLQRLRRKRPAAVTPVAAAAAGGTKPKSRRGRANGVAAAALLTKPAAVAFPCHRGGGGKAPSAGLCSCRLCRPHPPPRARGGLFPRWGMRGLTVTRLEMRGLTGRWRRRWEVEWLGLPAAVAPLIWGRGVVSAASAKAETKVAAAMGELSVMLAKVFKAQTLHAPVAAAMTTAEAGPAGTPPPRR